MVASPSGERVDVWASLTPQVVRRLSKNWGNGERMTPSGDPDCVKEMKRPQSIEAALQDAGWLRALAVQLVGGSSADDLVQDTYLAALDRRAEPRDWRAWLATVMRRKASNRWRSERRERDLHARWVAADPGAGLAPGSDEAEAASASTARLERLELQQALLAAVRELAPEFAEVVLRCTMDGEAPSEVAEDLGLPAGTVRSRLSRALEQLRGKLDERFGREAWLAGFLPWVAPLLHLPPAAQTAASSASTIPAATSTEALPLSSASAVTGWSTATASGIGGVLMYKWITAVAALVMLTLGARELLKEPAALQTPAVEIVQESRTNATAVQPPREAAGTARVAINAAPAPEALDQLEVSPIAMPEVMHLRVVEADTGLPLQGVAFRLLESQSFSRMEGELTEMRGEPLEHSDALGLLHIELQPQMPEWGALSKPGFAERVIALDPFDLPEGEAALAIALAPISELHVRVLDQGGVPVPGVVVSSVASMSDIEVQASGLGWLSTRNAEWDGRWRRSSAAPTDERGETQLGLFDVAVIELELRKAGELLAAARAPQIERFGDEDWVTLQLGQRFALRGQLLDADRQPIVGQPIELHFMTGERWRPKTLNVVLTDAEGRFAIEPVTTDAEGQPMDWLVFNGGYGEERTIPEDQRVQAQTVPWGLAVDGVVELELVAARTGSIAGVVVDLEGVEVNADKFGMVEVWTLEGDYAGSDSNVGANFEVAGLLPGTYAVTFRSGGNNPGPEVLATVGDRHVQLIALPSYDLDLEFIRGPSLSPETLIGDDFKVYLFPMGSGWPALSGRSLEPRTYAERVPWRVTGLEPDRYRLLVTTVDGLVGSIDVEVPSLGAGPVEVPMGAKARINIEVGFQAELQKASQLYVGWAGGEAVRWGGAIAQTIEVPPGIVTVWAERPDGTRATETITVAAGETRSVRLE